MASKPIFVIQSDEDCKRYIEKINKDYREKHIKLQETEDLIGENDIEQSNISGYHGREILELLQNADDAYQKSINLGKRPECDLDVSISYVNDVLTVSNSGTTFDRDGIISIIQGNNSSKHGNFIGCKGTGFRSVLNWANEIEIHSGYFNVKFSKEIASKFFDTIKDEEQIRKQIEKQKEKHKKLYVPMLSVPEYCENLGKSPKYDTVIKVVIDKNKLNDDFNVENQIKNIDSKILLFLPNTSSITITTNSGTVKYSRKRDDSKHIASFYASKVTIEKAQNGVVEFSRQYQLFEKTVKNKIVEDDYSKDINLAIAVGEDDENYEETHLYSYFPLLNTTTPFNCIMHAPYILSSQRNSLIYDPENKNKTIIQEQLNFLVEIATKFYLKNQYDKAIGLLTPRNITSYFNFNFGSDFSNFNLKEYYLSLINDKKIFLTVNGNYISFDEKLEIIQSDFPEVLRGKNFNNLIKYTTYSTAKNLIKLLNRSEYVSFLPESDLCNRISNLRASLTVKQRAECYIWWEANYDEFLPNLLKDQNQTWLEKGSECYFLQGDFDNVSLPNWINIPSIDPADQEALFDAASSTDTYKTAYEQYKQSHSIASPQPARVIADQHIYKLLTFKYRDKSSIVPTLNSSVKTYDHAVEFVQWLWDNYSSDQSWSPTTSAMSYNFPTADGVVASSNTLYFGKAYENDLSESLFDEQIYKPFAEPSVFGINKEDVGAFKTFISKFNVVDYPPISLIKVNNPSYNSVILPYDIRRKNNLSVKVQSIKNFDDIINKLETKDIIKWILNDQKLYNFLRNKKLNSYMNGMQQVEVSYQTYGGRTTTISVNTVDNYLLFVLNNTKWVNIDGKKHKPSEIILDNNYNFKSLVPIFTQAEVRTISHDLNVYEDDVRGVLSLFDFCKNVTSLCSNDFYGLLLQIPNCEESLRKALSKEVYNSLEKESPNKNFPDSDNKSKFFEIGKLLTKNGEFVLAKDVYLPSTLIVNKSKYNILDKNPRNSSDNFETILGCRKYDKKPVIKTKTKNEEMDAKFQADFNEFKRYARFYADSNAEIKKTFANLSIMLVSDIMVTVDDEEQSATGEFEEIRESQASWYIKLKDEEYDVRKLSVCIETIFSNIANTPGFDANKFGELFRSDEQGKQFLIIKDFGANYLKFDEYASEMKSALISALKKCHPGFDPEKYSDFNYIDFNNLSSENSMDHIIKILNELKIYDIKKLASDKFKYVFNLKEYYQKKINNITTQEKNNYKNFLFTKALTDKQKQKSFLTNLSDFTHFELTEEISTICDVEKDILYKEFGNWKVGNNKDADEEYTKNYKELNPEDVFQKDISEDVAVQQWIYFNNKTEFDNWITEKKNKQAQQSPLNDALEGFRDAIPIKRELPDHSTATVTTKRHYKKDNNVFILEKEIEINKLKKARGNIAELLIYNLLCKEYGEANVKPVSEAFVEWKLLPAGLAKSGDYDLEYTQNNKKFYVEVKSGDNNSFFLSAGEREWAKNHAAEYKLFFVSNIGEGETPTYIELSGTFLNDPKFNIQPVVEKYKVTF